MLMKPLELTPPVQIVSSQTNNTILSEADNKNIPIISQSLERQTSRSSLVSTLDTIKDKVTLVINSKNEKSASNQLKIVVGFFFVAILIFLIVVQVFYFINTGQVTIFESVTLKEKERCLSILNSNNLLAIESELSTSISQNIHPYPCIPRKEKRFSEDKDEACLEWKNIARLRMTQSTFKDSMKCYNFYWQSLREGVKLRDCFSVKDTQWYGGGEFSGATWPLNKGLIKNSPFVTGDEEITEWGNVIRKYFLNSNGVALSIEDQTPLFVSINSTKFCIEAKFDDYAYYYHLFKLPRLNYTLCVNDNLKAIHSSLLPESFWEGHSQTDLNTLVGLLKNPIWELTDQNGISSDKIEKFIEDIVGGRRNRVSNRRRGYILLDYSWQENMGDLEFSTTKFPDIKHVLDLITQSGFKLVLTVNPFVSTQSNNFKVGVEKRMFVMERSSEKKVPALTWFKDIPSAALVDITNNNTVEWFLRKLEKLSRELNSEALFYLDIGNTFHVPTYFDFTVPLSNPDLYGEHFTRQVMSQVPVIGVSGASSRRPKAPAFVFLTPTLSNWSHLRTVIPKMLHLSVIGYPFVNPGPVGGKLNKSSENSTLDFELFVRWWQLNTFLPMVQFTQPPSYFNTSMVTKVSRNLQAIRDDIVTPALIRFSNEAMRNSLPVIRPLWMVDESDKTALTVDDQFLIGDTILVAPILKKGKTKRNIYLPGDKEGKTVVWKRGSDGTFFKGGRWLYDMAVDLDDALYFIREESDTLPGIN